MKNKKIAFFLQNLSGGGAEKSVVNLSNYLINDSLEIDIVLVDSSTEVYLKDLDTKINIIDLNKNRSLKSIFKMRRYIKTAKPDVIMSSVTHINIILVLVKLVSGKTNTKFVLNQVNHLSSIIDHYTKTLVFKKIILRVLLLMYNFTDGVISMSRGVEKDLLNNGLTIKSKFIYNPIFSIEMLEKSKEEIIEKNEIFFIAIGRMVPQKNFSLLLDAFYLVNKEVKSKLIILGDGPLKPTLVKQIKELNLESRVLLKGFVDNPFSYLRKSNVFVLSSLWEGFGNVVVESLALGTQVVSTDCDSGPNEILENGKFGFLSSTFHKFELARLMVEALNNPIDSELIIKRGMEFSIESSAKKYKKFLLNI